MLQSPHIENNNRRTPNNHEPLAPGSPTEQSPQTPTIIPSSEDPSIDILENFLNVPTETVSKK
jgi:hypothetical protein